MAATQLKPRQALNKAFLKVKPNRAAMEAFKSALATLFDRVDPAESEEFRKNLLSDLLKHTGFAPERFINTKGRNDLVIHSGSDTQKAELSDLAEQCAAAKQSGSSGSRVSPHILGVEGQPTHFVFSPSEIVTLTSMFHRHIHRPFRPHPPESRLKRQLRKIPGPLGL